MTPTAAIAPAGILGAYFAGPTWDRWRAVLAAAYGETLTPEQDALFREVAERDPPPQRVRELWVVAGRRAGKDSIASAIALVAALGDYSAVLRPGERATILCLASTKDQATLVLRYIAAYFSLVPLLKPLLVRETAYSLELSNGVEVVVTTNDFRSVRGRAIVCVILDEVAYYRSDESANPDHELYNALEPAMQQFGDRALMIGISSPYRRTGLLFEKWKQSYGKPDESVLVIRGTSRQFNQTLSQKTVDDRLARDPEAGGAEYLAQWRNDLSDFLDRELVEDAVDGGVIVRPPHPKRAYRAFTDVSGGRGDSFTAAIAHDEDGVAVLDCLFERRSPFNPTEVVSDLAGLLREYGLNRVCGDKYAAGWTTEAFAAAGISYDESSRDRSAIYLDALPLFTSGRIRLLDNPRLVHQFVSLERRQTRFGKDRVDHPQHGGADDLCNAAAGAAVLVATDRRPGLVRQSDLLADGAPLPIPRWLAGAFATLTVSKAGIAAVIYTGMTHQGLLVLDYDVGPLARDTYENVADRVTALGQQCLVQNPSAVGIYAPPELIRPMAVAGFYADEIPEHLLDVEALLIGAASHIAAGAVKICEPAHEKAKTSPFGGALDFRGGDLGDDPLRRAALWAIALGLDPQ
jgi:hypothetical protein